MTGTERQTATGKVLLHFGMSLDGFVATPDHGHAWMTGISFRPGHIQEYAETTGAVLAGRSGWDAAGDRRPYGAAWHGSEVRLDAGRATRAAAARCLGGGAVRFARGGTTRWCGRRPGR